VHTVALHPAIGWDEVQSFAQAGVEPLSSLAQPPK
jgi:hypothetical protein